MTPDDLTRSVPPADATHDPSELALDAGLAAAFGGDTTHHRPPAAEPEAGTVIDGKYRLSEKIGEGGMGGVWVAHQTEPVKRKVAIKLIKLGMDSKAVLARFDAERQALAVMDHPNIAKVLDGGLHDGRPYFVMELVKGVPITQFCDERKLTPRQRLELFVPVCQAIQHAHQKGVIHRDIKPSNVLVALYDDKPVPKVIDFGVAKATGPALTEHTLETGFGAVVGTPAYMSPEQASLNNLDIDTRSDVYSLGILLYELLTGSPPFTRNDLEKKGLLEMLRVVREEEPPRPSVKLSTAETLPSLAAVRGTEPKALTGLLRSELDWIVMKALEKERARRYDTANGFAGDILRYLSGEPVQAVPPSLGYRVRRFWRKNRTAIVTTALVAVMLKSVTLLSIWQMSRAVIAEQLAETRREDAEFNALIADANAYNAEVNAEKAKIAWKYAEDVREEQAADRYISDMQLLPLVFDKGTAAEVNKLLASHIPKPGERDRRGFEWYYWNRQQNQHVVSDRFGSGADDFRTSWAVSRDGQRVARLDPPAGADGLPTLTVWDRATRQVVLTHRIPSRPPEGGANGSAAPVAPRFSPDGRRVVVEWSYAKQTPVPPGGVVGRGGPNALRIVNQVCQVIDVDTGKVLLEPVGTSRFVRWVSHFSGDGRRYAVPSAPPQGEWGGAASSTVLSVWDLESGKLLTPEKPAVYFHAVLHPDGNTFLTSSPPRDPDPALAALGGGTTQLSVARLARRDVKTGAERWGWDVPCGSLDDLTVSADGRLLAVTLRDGPSERARAVGIWDAATGKEVASWSLPGQDANPFVLELAFSPHGSRLMVRLQAETTNPATGAINRFSRSGTTLLDTRTGEAVSPLEVGSDPTTGAMMAYSPDEKRLAVANDHGIYLCDARFGGRPILTIRPPLNRVRVCRFTPDGQRLWTLETDGAYKEWDCRPPRPVVVKAEVGNSALSPLIEDVTAASGDGSRFAQLAPPGENDRLNYQVRVRDADGRPLKLLTPSQREVIGTPRQSQALDRAGRRVLLSRCETRTIRIGETLPDDWRAGLTPPDLTVWDTDTGERLFHTSVEDWPVQATRDGGHVVALSPDGTTVAVGVESAKRDGPDRILRFDVKTGRERPACTLGGAATLLALAPSPDGKRVAAVAAAFDVPNNRVTAKLLVWDEAGGEPAVSADLIRDVPGVANLIFRRGFLRGGVAWTPDGSRLVVSHLIVSEVGFAVHNAATGKQVVTLERAADPLRQPRNVTWVVCSPDGRRVAAFLSRGTTTELKVWDTTSGKDLLTLRKRSESRGFGFPTLSGIRQLAFTPDGHKLAAWEFEQIQEWSEERGDYTVNAYVRSVWDASPPEAKK